MQKFNGQLFLIFDFEKDINFCVVIVCKYLHLYALVTIMSGFIF